MIPRPGSYRSDSRNALERAKCELESGDKDRLAYAALELRMALEALVYDRAAGYRDELSGRDLETWQPRALLKLLLELDPLADKSSTIAFGKEEEYGVPAPEMHTLGTDRTLSLKEIQTFYDRLGSYLHTPTHSQIAKGKVSSPDRMRARCFELTSILDEVLASPVFNANFSEKSDIECAQCGEKIVRRLRHDQQPVVAKCLGCVATYDLVKEADGRVRWTPRVHGIPCGDTECDQVVELWERELETEGTCWTCPSCRGKNTLGRGLIHTKTDEQQG